MYPSAKELQKPEVRAFMEFVLENQEEIAGNAQIVPMTSAQTQEAQTALSEAAS